MALPPSTANWHWRQKDVSRWANSWFEQQLVDSVICDEGKVSSRITSLKTFEGDAEVGMRKSKLLTIYDLRLEYKWSGVAEDGTAVEGTLTLPEVSHEVGADGDGDYHFETTLTTSETAAVRQLYALMRKKLPAFLKSKLDPFPEAMLAAHGKDLKVEGTPTASGAATPNLPIKTSTTAPAKLAEKLNTVKGLNTTTVKVEGTFASSANDLFDLLTQPEKIMMWSRAAAKSNPVVGEEFSIFGGNISGKYVALDKPNKITQTWSLKNPNWPDDHTGTLTTTLKQGSDSTAVTFELSGVPTGQEDEIRNNLNGYYVRGFQSIGLGTAL